MKMKQIEGVEPDFVLKPKSGFLDIN